MSFELWRQDDNGNRFLVGNYPDRSAAERRLAELTRSLHKQTYWIAVQGDDGEMTVSRSIATIRLG
jgi:hypothetical protein